MWLSGAMMDETEYIIRQQSSVLLFHKKKSPKYQIKLHMLPTVGRQTSGTTAPLSLRITVIL